ncbi:MAG: transporter substrate-binding domain-containing protein [Rhodospirillales bacterium]|nr:transporter substrate-binding domain-containing protein [Rhodospirillales bacterium]
MKRLNWAGALAVLLCAWGAQAADMPPLPAAIKEAGVLKVGVRCDQPPYGYQDQKGEFAGIEVDMAKTIADWAFGSPSKIEMTCVTADNRIPQLNARKVDLLIATLGMTPERARVIDFTKGYNWGGSDVTVPKDSPIKSLADLKGKTLAVLKGTTQAAWLEAKMPDVDLLKLNSVADGVQAVKQGRAVGFAGDKATAVVIVGRDPALRMVGQPYAITEGGIGVRKNEPEWLAYLNAAIDRMRAEKMFGPWIDKWVPAENRPLFIEAFTTPKPAEG